MTAPTNSALTEVLKAIDGLADAVKLFVTDLADLKGTVAAKSGRQPATRKRDKTKDAAELTLEAVRKAFLPLVDKFGNAGVKEILGQFDTAKMSKLESRHFADAIEAIEAKLAASGEDSPDDETGKEAVTIEQVRAAVQNIKDQSGNKGVKEFLANFKVSKVSDIDAADYADALIAAKDYEDEDDPTA